jgi:hypothetical protein
MSINTMTYYSNSIQGIPGVGADIDLFRADASPKYAAGHLVERADGNRFRYCHVGTATNANQLVGPTTATGGATYNAITVVAPASAQVVAQEYPILAGQVGSHYIEATVASIGADKYQGSYLVTTAGTGVGNTYRIIGNTATGNPASGNIRIHLAEPLAAALTASTGTIIVSSMFTDLATTPVSSPQVTGVLWATTTAAKPYAWVCTRGVTGCQEDGTNTITAGQQIVSSAVTTGAYMTMYKSVTTLVNSSVAYPLIGYSITPASAGAASNRQGVIYLTIE